MYALRLDVKFLIRRRLLVPDKGLKEDRRFALLSRRFPTDGSNDRVIIAVVIFFGQV